MPKLMEKNDWMQAVANAGLTGNIWCENISANGGILSIVAPEQGAYQVILVKIDNDTAEKAPRQKSARDYIGYCRKYRPEWHSTAEAMKELREGEE